MLSDAHGAPCRSTRAATPAHTALPPPDDESNIFAKIISGDIPSTKVFEDEDCLAILDAFPSVPGHCLLIPKAPARNILDMSPDVAARCCRELPRLAKAVQEATGCDGINIIQNCEAAAGQMVFHAHFHVVPRSKDDKLLKLPAGAKEMLKPADAKEMAEKIQANLGAASGGGGGGAGEGGVLALLFAAVAVLGGVVAKLLSDGGQLF